METTTITKSTVAEIVASDYRTAEVFKKYGIDFCCGGKKTIDKVCSEKNVSAESLVHDLEGIWKAEAPASQNYKDWEAGFLADYIVNVHHGYVKRNISQITEYAEKVNKVHSDHNPELSQILVLWKQVVADLSVHMQKEELMLFPYIKKMERILKGEVEYSPAVFGSVKNPIRMMEGEHDAAGAFLSQISKLSADYTPPAHACNTYRVLFAKLQEFENDLHTHVHLENNILFPKAEQMEEELKKTYTVS
jgi:regulator of cell morphogenesis and NO signaling